MKVVAIFFMFCACISLNLKQASAQEKQPPVLNHIAVYVNDLKTSTDFYNDIIGLEKMDEPFKDGKHTWFTLGVQGQLHLISGAKKGMEQIKDRHLCFSVVSIDDFMKTLDKNHIIYSNWKGDSKSPTVRPDGVRQIYFQDPDGYWVEINNDLQ
jgi:lactoylglutathione lyase